jgi:hypothetical protein
MIKWEYSFYITNIQTDEVQAGGEVLYHDEDKLKYARSEDGKSDAAIINEMGVKGWELVSVTPICGNLRYNGFTDQLLFTFKRPIDEN